MCTLPVIYASALIMSRIVGQREYSVIFYQSSRRIRPVYHNLSLIRIVPHF